MLRYSLIFGGITGAIVIAILSITILAFGIDSAGGSQAFGYTLMLAVHCVLFIGVKRYRDLEMGGVITFKKAALVGLAMAVVSAVVYAIGWEITLRLTDFAFIEGFAQVMIDDIKAEGLSPSAEAAKITEMQGWMELYRNPFIRLPMTMTEIMPVGVLVALVSAFVLKNPKVLPLRSNPSAA
ncbi:MAG: DUF4199 domain-containing protein [Pseudomonadota bacterium]